MPGLCRYSGVSRDCGIVLDYGRAYSASELTISLSPKLVISPSPKLAISLSSALLYKAPTIHFQVRLIETEPCKRFLAYLFIRPHSLFCPPHNLFQLGEISACNPNVPAARYESFTHTIEHAVRYLLRRIKLDYVREATGSRSHGSEQLFEEHLVTAPRVDLEAYLRKRGCHFHDDVLIQIF